MRFANLGLSGISRAVAARPNLNATSVLPAAATPAGFHIQGSSVQ